MAVKVLPFYYIYADQSSHRKDWWVQYLLEDGILAFAFFAAVVADLWFGRHRVMVWGTTIIWLGLVMLTVFMSLYHLLLYSSHLIWYPTINLVWEIILDLGMCLFLSNVIQFGVDQMPEASSDELSSFVHWFVFIEALGKVFGINFITAIKAMVQHMHADPPSYYPSLLYGMLFSGTQAALLITLNCFSAQLNLVKSKPDPMKYHYIFHVLTYSTKNRARARLIDHSISTRIDIAKGKYGGPFQNDKVENVKTLKRIFLLLLLFAGYLVAIQGTVSNFELLKFVNQKQNVTVTSWIEIIDKNSISALITIAYVLLHEFVAIPLFRKYIPNMLKKIWIAGVCYFLSSISNLAINSVGHLLNTHGDYGAGNSTNSTNSTTCIFSDSYQHLNISPSFVLAIPSVLGAIGSVISYTAVLEFILAQSPNSVQGLLFGLKFSILYVGYTLGYVITLPFKYYYPTSEQHFSCGSAYYLLCAVLGGIGLVLLSIMLYRYVSVRLKSLVSIIIIRLAIL